MATGRTVTKWIRVYHDGYDISGMSRSIGPTGIVYDEADLTTLSDAVKGYLPGTGNLNVDVINGIMDNTATVGLHTVGQSAGGIRTILIAFGIRGEPAAGDPIFGGQFMQGAYQTADEGGAVVATLPFLGWAANAVFNSAYRPFGVLLHAKGAETSANTATGIDDEGAATSKGGYMTYHVFAGDGTATLKVQDAATNSNPSFSDISGVTTGVIDCSSVQYGIVAASTTTIRRYLRWQIALGTATTVTFALGFTRG